MVRRTHMSTATVPKQAPVSRARRLQALQTLLAAVGVLTLARVLHPDPRGFGTHQQLLLPPCLLHTLLHVPCPLCGMTTGFALMARGRIMAAAACNLLAPPAFAVTMLLALLALWGLGTGRAWVPSVVRRERFGQVVLVIVAVCWLANITIHLGLIQWSFVLPH